MEQYFWANHYVAKGMSTVTSLYNKESQGQNSVVDIMWGLEGINKTEVSFYNASDIGTPIYDDSFNFSSAENQLEVYRFCQYLKT